MSPASRLLGYVARYRRVFLVGLVCVVSATAITLAGPWVLKHAIDDLTTGVTAAKVRFYSIALLALAAAAGVFRFLMRRILIGASRDIEYDLRNDFFAALQRLDVAYLQRRRTGDLMSRATSDLNAVRQMIGPAVMYTSSTLLTFLVATGLMFSINPRLTLLALLPLPLVSLSVFFFGRVIHRRALAIQEQISEMTAVAQENLAGVRVVRAYGRERHEIQRFRAANLEYLRRNSRLIQVQGLYQPLMGLLMGIATMIVLWVGSRDVVAGGMSVGELVAFNAYLVSLAWPMIAFGWVTNLIQRGMASWKRMLEVLDAQPVIRDAEVDIVAPAAPLRGEIELRHLSFAHDDTTVLRDISAHVPAGTTMALVGATGSGKSTFLQLVSRLNDPPPGALFVDGIDVRRLPLSVLRGAIGVVPQEPFLFSATIADNIAFGARGAQGARARLEEAARIAMLDEDLQQLPRGLDTVIGERGITLSGGQRQRVAIARALVVEPRILILDDALSAVDTYTEEEILRRLSAFMRERTTLIVSHRISTVRAADQILVLDEGRVAERGTHDQLVALDGRYAQLYRRQLLEEELATS